ncbi:hypothetical protein SESBI_19618 [Sesbania bispinosa]|nr:hypothetical protein SESBI_19618 [Sesbania bispinosa]
MEGQRVDYGQDPASRVLENRSSDHSVFHQMAMGSEVRSCVMVGFCESALLEFTHMVSTVNSRLAELEYLLFSASIVVHMEAKGIDVKHGLGVPGVAYFYQTHVVVKTNEFQHMLFISLSIKWNWSCHDCFKGFKANPGLNSAQKDSGQSIQWGKNMGTTEGSSSKTHDPTNGGSFGVMSNKLANIVWGEAGESDDHIVPYPESSEDLHNKKEWNQDASAVKLIEQKGIEAKTDFHGRKLGSSSKLDNSAGTSNSGYGTNSWPDLSLSSTAKTDQSSLGTEVSKTSEETIKLKKDVEIFPSTREDEEQGDFVDYAWDNIGSFDDLDRIFRNDDPIFGHVSLENSDELWSSKDVNNSPVPILSEAQSPASALRNRSEPLEIKTKYDHRNDRSFSASFKRIGHSASHDKQNAHATTGNAGYARGRSIPTEKEQQDMVGMTTSVPSAEDVGTENEFTDKITSSPFSAHFSMFLVGIVNHGSKSFSDPQNLAGSMAFHTQVG